MEEKNYRFIAEVTPNQQLMEEGYRENLGASWTKPGNLVLAALVLLCIVILIIFGSGWFDILLAVLLAVLLLCFMFVLPKVSARNYMRQLQSVYGDKLTSVISFDEDAFHTQSSTGAKADTAYDQIIAVSETTHAIVLRRKMRVFHVLDKSKISGGTLPEFRAFLQEKMPGAKFRWKADA